MDIRGKRIVFWGTYSLFPRQKLLIKAAKKLGCNVEEIHRNVWEGENDKAQIKGIDRLFLLVKWLMSYPRLIYRFLKFQQPDAIVVMHMGFIDVLMIYPFAKLKGVPILWDVYISIYDAVVFDRKLISRRNPLAILLYALEWVAMRCVSCAFLDTEVHSEYISGLYQVDNKSIKYIHVGVEEEFFTANVSTKLSDNGVFSVLFYGQYIPLHGVEYIVDAAEKLKYYENIQFTLIGIGQTRELVDKKIRDCELTNIVCLDWVEYPNLIDRIAQADVCLGIFGETSKAQRVIPNKLYQILAANKPFITADTPAIQELISNYDVVNYRLVPSANGLEIGENILEMIKMSSIDKAHRLQPVIGVEEVMVQLQKILKGVLK